MEGYDDQNVVRGVNVLVYFVDPVLLVYRNLLI